MPKESLYDVVINMSDAELVELKKWLTYLNIEKNQKRIKNANNVKRFRFRKRGGNARKYTQWNFGFKCARHPNSSFYSSKGKKTCKECRKLINKRWLAKRRRRRK